MTNMTERNEKDSIKQTLQQLNPTEEQKQKMWKNIQTQAKQEQKSLDEKKQDEKNPDKENLKKENHNQKKTERKAGRKIPAIWKKTVAAAVIAAAVITTGVGGNAATGGKMLRTIREMCGISQTEKEITRQAKNIAKNQTEVYAPEIYDINAKRVVFGTSRGLIIYDIAAEQITGTIDVQEIDCIYFNADQKKTHVLVEDDQLVIFNTENGKPMGKYYRFDLSQTGKQPDETTLLGISASGKDSRQFAEYQKQVQKKEKSHYVDTFASMPDAYFLDKNAQKEHNIMYSENSYCWKDQAGKEYTSCLVAAADSDKYTLYTEQKDTKTIQKLALDLDILSLPMLASRDVEKENTKGDASENSETFTSKASDGVMDDTMLPQFIYSGKDQVMKAICDYMTDLAAEEYGLDNNTKVWIPGVTEYGRKKTGSCLYVYGKFMNYSYKRNGKILEAVDGDTAAVRFVLKKASDGYQVIEMDQPKDGQEYAENLKELTADAPEMYEKYFAEDKEKEEKQRKELIRMYVSDNELTITYYKDYGWDPVAIDEK